MMQTRTVSVGRMSLSMLLGVSACQGVGTSVAGAQAMSVVPAAFTTVTGPVADSARKRPRAIEYSDWYARRLAIHKAGSLIELPLFAAEYVLGDRLLNGNGEDWERNAHLGVALGLGALFTVNTVTGVWNLVESRKDPAGRTRRLLHSALMLGADAGFTWAGATGGDASGSASVRSRHKTVAIGSMGLATAGTLLMWLWKD